LGHAPDLTLEHCWVIPKSELYYLNEGSINAEFRNIPSSSITVEDVVCRFQTEEGLVPYVYEAHADKKARVESNHRVTIKIPFVAELCLKGGTNVYSFSISYERSESEEIFTLAMHAPSVENFVIIYPLRGQSDKCFFISHKIPEDTALATKLDHYLQKIGFKGWLAEANLRPGLDIWSEKIMPTIKNENCIGIIALWDSLAIKGPDAMIRELKYAKDCSKKQILLVERALVEHDKGGKRDLGLPTVFQKRKEYQRSLGATITEIDLVHLVMSIGQTYQNGRL
jgi:hypothetical protein